MRPYYPLFSVTLLCLTALSGLAVAAGPHQDLPVAPKPLDPSPMMVEIESALDTEQTELKKLYADLAQAGDPVAALEVQKKIETVKRGAERSLLVVQLKYARLNGSPKQVDTLTSALEAFDHPRRIVNHKNADAPRNSNGSGQ